MGQRRIRRKRRREFRKPDAVIVTLSSFAIILLFVWGGLYWKESSERALIVHANGEDQVEQSLQYDEGLQSTTESEGLNYGVEEQSSATSETVAPVGQSDDQPGVDKPGVDKPGDTSEAPQLPDAAKPTQETVTKPKTHNQAKSESHSTTGIKSPSTTEPDSPSTNQTDPPINQAQKYEQKMIQVQAMCMKDVKEVLSGAESSIQQLDKTDPIAVQAWKDKLTKELATAEAACDAKFQEVAQNAENDSVSPKVIEEWRQTFSAMKENLQGESRAKLRQLMGG
ncbi:hypothetical protein [Cohnella silvisoli]|uniref:DUF4363 family protein n=1 Tax=Cohnella silvisoli TaxID=2873699 RepID=A0ABV1KXD5_9BACL|nr:hypothetical protein [Cohnella silvisoli]MCD9024073.1 hypothetical protein [Cohnella silvisoli]